MADVNYFRVDDETEVLDISDKDISQSQVRSEDLARS